MNKFFQLSVIYSGYCTKGPTWPNVLQLPYLICSLPPPPLVTKGGRSMAVLYPHYL
jgi:hypothetical protein